MQTKRFPLKARIPTFIRETNKTQETQDPSWIFQSSAMEAWLAVGKPISTAVSGHAHLSDQNTLS